MSAPGIVRRRWDGAIARLTLARPPLNVLTIDMMNDRNVTRRRFLHGSAAAAAGALAFPLIIPSRAFGANERLNITTISREETIPIGAHGRPVVVYQAPIRLIATRWIYDAATKTLFTSDMWTHTWRETPDV